MVAYKGPIRFKGLDAQKKYTVKEINLYPGTSSVLKGNQVYTGDFLMNVGINPEISSYHTSIVLQLEAVNKYNPIPCSALFHFKMKQAEQMEHVDSQVIYVLFYRSI